MQEEQNPFTDYMTATVEALCATMIQARNDGKPPVDAARHFADHCIEEAKASGNKAALFYACVLRRQVDEDFWYLEKKDRAIKEDVERFAKHELNFERDEFYVDSRPDHLADPHTKMYMFEDLLCQAFGPGAGLPIASKLRLFIEDEVAGERLVELLNQHDANPFADKDVMYVGGLDHTNRRDFTLTGLFRHYVNLAPFRIMLRAGHEAEAMNDIRDACDMPDLEAFDYVVTANSLNDTYNRLGDAISQFSAITKLTREGGRHMHVLSYPVGFSGLLPNMQAMFNSKDLEEAVGMTHDQASRQNRPWCAKQSVLCFDKTKEVEMSLESLTHFSSRFAGLGY